ncbi:MAG: type sorting protein [Bacteroidota bacterium]|nr:type sorting protein [Bacteroidota bacterium]
MEHRISNRIILLMVILLISYFSKFSAQESGPWQSPLMCAISGDGINFNTPEVFQDSSGVPAVIRKNGDTLICVFQWFRQPKDSPSWDRVAAKLSFDNGNSWTEPQPIQIDGFPSNYQRPFDPALALTQEGKIRLYYSSSNGMPQMGMDTSINTYSAIGSDGIHYVFEPNPRVDHPTSRVIDPTVIFFRNMWHYISPAGAPQDGAYHYISNEGINFLPVPKILSDPNHNWTGNYMVLDTGELRFYGCGNSGIWYNYSKNGGEWKGYIGTNLKGGDPSVVKLSEDKYLIIFVGQKYPSAVEEKEYSDSNTLIWPNPAESDIFIRNLVSMQENNIIIFNELGEILIKIPYQERIQLGNLPSGHYFLKNGSKAVKFIKK